MVKHTIDVMVTENVNPGQFVNIRKRTCKERLFTRPWRPLQKHIVPKQAKKKIEEIANIPGVKYVKVYENN